MMSVPMCLSILQAPKCRIHTLANFYFGNLHTYSSNYGMSSKFRLLCSKNYGLEGGYSRRWIRRPITTKTEGRNSTTKSNKLRISHEALETKVSSSTTINVNKTEISEFQRIQYCDIRQKIAEDKDLASMVTVIVFDIETTGLHREKERIIEIALQDLRGGENSTFEALVNPECYVPNSHVHGISTDMVCKPDVPRMKDLIPILLQYVRSRQKPGGYVMFVAHNARVFDVPFLRNEFSRCSYEIPQNWLFLDTLVLARELMKSEGLKATSGISLPALRVRYNIELNGMAHRAMSDVRVLSSVFQRLTFDLQLSLPGLVGKSFIPSDLDNTKKKKS